MNVWHRSYVGIYGSGAKIKTEFDFDKREVCMSLRRESGAPVETYVFTQEQAIEAAYALIKAAKEIDDNNQPAGDEE